MREVICCNDPFSPLHLRDDQFARFAFIKSLDAMIADKPKRLRQVFLYEGVADLPAPLFYEYRHDGIIFLKSCLCAVQVPGFRLCNDEPVFRQVDSGLDQCCKRQPGIFMFCKKSCDSARNAGCQMTILTKIRLRIAAGIQVHVPGSCGGSLLPEIQGDILSLCQVGDHETASTNITGPGIHDGQGQLCSYGGIQRIASFLQYGYTRHTGQWMSRYNGAMRGFHLFADAI